MSAQDHLDSPELRSPSAEIDEPTSQRKPSGGQEHTKVKRATVACSACRARKIKCSGDKPICTTCAKGSVQCEYPIVRKRKREGTNKKDSGGDRLDSALAAPLFTQTSNVLEPTVGSSSFDSNPFVPPFNIFTVTPQHASTSFVAHPVPDWAQSPWGNLTGGDVGGQGMGNVDQNALDMSSWDMGAKAPSRAESAAGIHTSASDIDSGQMWENTSNTSNVDRRSGAHPKARFRVPYFRYVTLWYF